MRQKYFYETPEQTVVRWWSQVDRRAPDECWPWVGYLETTGYGRIYVRWVKNRKRTVGAHRFALYVRDGVLPVGGVVMHHCDNKRCVNPAHLRHATQSENVQDAYDKGLIPRVKWGMVKHWNRNRVA